MKMLVCLRWELETIEKLVVCLCASVQCERYQMIFRLRYGNHIHQPSQCSFIFQTISSTLSLFYRTSVGCVCMFIFKRSTALCYLYVGKLYHTRWKILTVLPLLFKALHRSIYSDTWFSLIHIQISLEHSGNSQIKEWNEDTNHIHRHNYFELYSNFNATMAQKKTNTKLSIAPKYHDKHSLIPMRRSFCSFFFSVCHVNQKPKSVPLKKIRCIHLRNL